MKSFSLILIILIGISSLSIAQRNTRWGLLLGVEMQSTSHTNPYVVYQGTEYAPTSYQGFEDNTTHFYFPFGYYAYNEDFYTEFSTSAAHLLIVGIANLLNPNKEYKYTTDKVYIGDSYADGYIPVFNDFEQNTSSEWGLGNGQGIEASYNEQELFRLAFSGSLKEYYVPISAGVQGGIGKIGVHFANVQEGHEPSPANTDGPGLTNFNDFTHLSYGVNIGKGISITGKDLLYVLAYYDWFYFMDGVDEAQGGGNRLTIEATYFPFENGTFLGNLSFKGYYKNISIPFMKNFNEVLPVDYSNSTIGLGVNLFLL
ncbi:MAG: hypothetical protein SCALA702_09240 [Melioribacteraceae bacterium]|nr:MAG: hypothetical protein SCALA702_09240 [Melioribacteraceae bacterium]